MQIHLSNLPQSRMQVKNSAADRMIQVQNGRLHIGWQHAKKSVGEQEDRQIIQLTLTARGPVAGDGDPKQKLLDGLDLGHKTIVRTFSSLMSTDANKCWGLKNACD